MIIMDQTLTPASELLQLEDEHVAHNYHPLDVVVASGSGAVLEASDFVAGLDDVAVLGEPIQERGRHLGVAEHTGLISGGEDEVGQHGFGGRCPVTIGQILTGSRSGPNTVAIQISWPGIP